jgi:hypothetical protein
MRVCVRRCAWAFVRGRLCVSANMRVRVFVRAVTCGDLRLWECSRPCVPHWSKDGREMRGLDLNDGSGPVQQVVKRLVGIVLRLCV